MAATDNYINLELEPNLRNELRMQVREFPINEVPDRYVAMQDPAMPRVNRFPVAFYCKDGMGYWKGPFLITRIFYIQRGVARRAGGSGIQYKVQVDGKYERDLFYDVEWFFEKPEEKAPEATGA